MGVDNIESFIRAVVGPDGRPLIVEPQTKLYEPNQPSDSLYFLRRGIVAIQGKTPTGETVTAGLISSGIFGEEALAINPQRDRSFTAITWSRTEVVTIPRIVLDTIVRAKRSLSVTLSELQMDAMQKTQRHTVQMREAIGPKLARVLDLLWTTQESGLPIGVLQLDIASAIDETRESTNKSLGRLRKAEILNLSRDGMSIDNEVAWKKFLQTGIIPR